ncbi:glycoside hydrolase [Novosphingobium beihaiensis]|uniref:Glycoside hydrolase n=1 Tax=Novosphingobium beihaiensis TaxID=2930389 RepID=A0ABT0BTW2_9SPHN|nr:glycoside hydrolase [Novosphingobium beihaiensis]MCJ2188393.1 glycoside hydrolase [Novosphingobium beihaiensis]
MHFTFVGMIQLLIGSALLFQPLRSLLVFLLFSGLFGGSSAVTLTALGNSSIPPVQFALLFVFLRILMPRGGYFALLVEGVKANFLFVLFTLYGMAAAFAAPRIFAGQLNVAPMRFTNARSLFDTVPLEPTAQNLTAAVYLLGALLVALAGYVAMRTEGGIEALVKGSVVLAWVHAVTGLVAAFTKGTPVEAVFALFRNGTYAQLDQSYQGFNRIDGLFPEASGWAAFGIAWFIFNCECWYRSVWARHTGVAAVVLGGALFISTSGTAYVGIGCYLMFFLARLLIFPKGAEPVRLRQAVMAGLSVLFLIAVALAAIPSLALQVSDMILHMTVDKGSSSSGQQRLFWAMQGFSAFMVSGGLGIGPGSFRSSSLFTAILGTMGVIGVMTFAGYVISIIRPVGMMGARRGEAVAAVMTACATTACVVLVPAAISSPNSHPGTNFALFAGAALALRRMLPAIPVRPRFTLCVSRLAPPDALGGTGALAPATRGSS